AYSVWAAMNKQTQGEGLVYVNVKKRIRRMVNLGLLEPDRAKTKEGIRGRKEFKLTTKGLEKLTDYFVSNYENVPSLVEYMDSYGIDMTRTVLGDLVMEKLHDTLNFFTFFIRTLKNNPEIAAVFANKFQEEMILARREIDSVLDYKPSPSSSTSTPTSTLTSKAAVQQKTRKKRVG
ncbi:MAG: hypothetical protein ACRD8W_24225, partial [Nitrososphaeraceae archaeon]